MSEAIIQAVKEAVDSPLLAVFILSALPLIELRGAIPAALLLGVEPWQAMLVAWAGSGLAVPLIIAVLRPALDAMKHSKLFGKISRYVESNFSERADKTCGGSMSEGKKLLAVYCFVALPLPMTGVWSGSAIAAFSGVNFYKSVIAVLLGNLTAASLLSLICTFCASYVDVILNIFVIVTFALLIAYVVKFTVKTMLKKRKSDN
ncbi:MAG: small multi-drug export protein [Clostridia bacterium]|nr:small multi-drug export protein [Clostridia bacterium]